MAKKTQFKIIFDLIRFPVKWNINIQTFLKINYGFNVVNMFFGGLIVICITTVYKKCHRSEKKLNLHNVMNKRAF